MKGLITLGLTHWLLTGKIISTRYGQVCLSRLSEKSQHSLLTYSGVVVNVGEYNTSSMRAGLGSLVILCYNPGD